MGRSELKKIHLLNGNMPGDGSDRNAEPVREDAPKKRMNRWLKFGLRMGCTVVLFFFLVR